MGGGLGREGSLWAITVCVCECVCFLTFLRVYSYGTHMHAHRERLQHHKVLSGQGTVGGGASTACSNSSDTGLTYLRGG